MQREVGALAAGGGTNMSGGLAHAALLFAPRAAGERQIALLLSDGQPNIGASAPAAGSPSLLGAPLWISYSALLFGSALLLLAVCPCAAVQVDRIHAAVLKAYGAEAAMAVREWGELLATVAGATEAVRVRRVNEFFNRNIEFVEDETLWGQPDYWASPLETLVKESGDCEDFAIAKYASLRMLGVADAKLRLIYVRAKQDDGASQAHMVLGYYADPAGEPLVLDNLMTDLRPASRRPDLSPIFSFNAEGLWTPRSATPAASSTARLSRWRDVLARMRAQGFELDK